MPAAPETHKLKVEVIEATDLLAYDWGGTSDPLVRCQLFLKQCASLKPLQPILSTKEVPKTLAPTWGETLEFEFVDGAAVLRCTVLDKNMLGTDLMGIVEASHRGGLGKRITMHRSISVPTNRMQPIGISSGDQTLAFQHAEDRSQIRRDVFRHPDLRQGSGHGLDHQPQLEQTRLGIFMHIRLGLCGKPGDSGVIGIKIFEVVRVAHSSSPFSSLRTASMVATTRPFTAHF